MCDFYYYFYYSFVQFYRVQGTFFRDDPYVWAVISISMVPSALLWSVLLAAQSAEWKLSDSLNLVECLPDFLQFGWIYIAALGANWVIFLRTKKCIVIDKRFSRIPLATRRKGHFFSGLVLLVIVASWFYQILNFEQA